MRNINRRDFIERTTKAAAGLAVSNIFADNGRALHSNGITAMIPMPIQVVIDDIGWWSGEDGSLRQEPYRTGINRNHVPADYQAIVDLGKALNIRPQAAMVLCEWDRENILRSLPTSTWMGKNWNNDKWVGPWLEEAADIIRNNKKHFEFTIHGIGHEYWTNGGFTRAEWADKQGVMRPIEQIEKHLYYYEKLMIQNQLGPFPTSFVPTAFLHSFGKTSGHDISMAGMLKKRNVDYINTPFEDMFGREKVSHGIFGFDEGVITVDRGRDVLSWKSIGKIPNGELIGPTCGLHWPNLLHPNPEQNNEIVNGWVNFLKPYNDKPETLLATDSLSFRNQLIHHVCTRIQINETYIDIHFKEVDKLPNGPDRNEIIIKVVSKQNLIFKSEMIKISNSKIMQQEAIKLYTLVLERIPGSVKARIKFKIS